MPWRFSSSLSSLEVTVNCRDIMAPEASAESSSGVAQGVASTTTSPETWTQQMWAGQSSGPLVGAHVD
eukprot:COSAG03_NODE_1837_length_3455_cov_3.077473_1_plen_68_part_00